MDVATVMRLHGGVATHAQLRSAAGRAALDEALRTGLVRRVARGRYVRADVVDVARVEAHRLSAVVGLRSAAASYGWSLKTTPDRPELVVPRGRRVRPGDQAGARIRWQRLAPEDVAGWRTSPVRTVMDCATALPFDEALAVADSALRSGAVTHADLMRAADRLPGRGRDTALDVAWFARDSPANAFESVVRAISYTVHGLRLVPQVRLRVGGRRVRPDLVDRDLRLVVEADSHEFHTSERAIDADCWRYDELVLDDWLVIRVSWVQAMFQQDWVASVLHRAAVRQDLARGGGLLDLRGTLRPTTVGRAGP